MEAVTTFYVGPYIRVNSPTGDIDENFVLNMQTILDEFDVEVCEGRGMDGIEEANYYITLPNDDVLGRKMRFAGVDREPVFGVTPELMDEELEVFGNHALGFTERLLEYGYSYGHYWGVVPGAF